MKHKLPELGYAYDALEPYIDAKTMEIHYSRHHQAYVDKLNSVLEKYPELQEKSAEKLIKGLVSLPEEIKTGVRNFGGGHVNHSFFWQILKKDIKMSGEIAKKIEGEFGGFDKFKEKFSNSAVSLFGSGWTWLVLHNGKLEIVTTVNQDSPLSIGKTPLLTIDVWEHSYYLKYQNKRADYVEAFFNIIDWEKVNELYASVK